MSAYLKINVVIIIKLSGSLAFNLVVVEPSASSELGLADIGLSGPVKLCVLVVMETVWAVKGGFN